ncbi:uncharacterized protein ARMOST_16132 [Armillaria ostoyae]|uniref:Heterokaryon incompatibility domain-containing protein n=1 Tax=Armillaria ostoyae TaxID=47428 RepID=A0A284RVB6_ARMOS|nr:uncharacterized protein ARMOST_16132 [Armillaria ostoyae]
MSESNIDDLKAAADHARQVWRVVTGKYWTDGRVTISQCHGRALNTILQALIDHAKLPEVTISVHTETGQAEEEIAVPLQRFYTGTKPVIIASLANTPCTELGLHGVLERLNTTLGTSYTLDTPGLPSLLEDCIAKNYDFGIAYGFLRSAWYTKDWSSIPAKIHECEEKDREMRRSALHRSDIIEPHVYPRRAWDLYSNRVLPLWTTGEPYPHPISHAWVDENDRVDVWTPINGHEWPVSIPKDTNLDLIRIEMLNKGLEYVWLDVLCLRQKGGLREDLRAEEWKLDVPTIGSLYQWNKIHCYLSGLGRPLSVKQDYFDSDRCWFNRAWTLQEISLHGHEICGVTPDGPLDAKPDMDGNYDTEVLTTFHQKLQGLRRLEYQPFDMLEEMRRRVSTNPVDKIAGMAILLRSSTIPPYYESQSLEDAWTAFMNTTNGLMRGDLFFKYPEPGNAGAKWRPSWDQVLEKSLPKHDICKDSYMYMFCVGKHIAADGDLCQGFSVENGFVRGLAVLGSPGTHRYGELLVEDAHRIQHVLNVTATHQYPIPEDTYTLIGPEEKPYRPIELEDWVQWVVGRRLSDESFEKLSVLTMGGDVAKRMLDVTGGEERVNILV